MENGKHRPIRTCVVCRNRFYQDELNRIQCINKKLVLFTGIGRSFYVCNSCKENKKFINYIAKKCNIAKNEAKEMINNFPFSILH